MAAAYLMGALVTPSTTFAAADTYEPNNDKDSAYLLTGSPDVGSYIYTTNDVDWYKFVVDAPCHVRIALVVPAGVDYDVWLYSAEDDSHLIASTDRTAGDDELIDYTIQDPGTYFIKVTGAFEDFSTSAAYTLRLRNPKTGDTYEPNNVRESAAGTLRSGVQVGSYIFTVNDKDWFSFGVTTPTHVRVALAVPAGVDYDVWLYSADDDAYLAASTDRTAGDDEAIDYTIQEPGTYFAQVTGAFEDYDQAQPYGLTVTGDGMSICTRIEGETRIDTAVRVSQRAFPNGADVAVIATAYNYPDALAGAVLARAYDAPLLLTDPYEVSYDLLQEINRLGVNDVLILGGYGAVSAEVADYLADDDTLVTRVSGEDRFETARKIAEKIVQRTGTKSTTAIVATGRNFADALAASPFAALRLYPILLTEPNLLSADARQALKDMGVTDVYLMGGTSAVSSEVESALKSMGVATERVAGDNRFATAVEMAKVATANGMTMSKPLLATGYNFPDALAGGVLGAQLGGPLLLTMPTDLPTTTYDYMNSTKAAVDEVIVLGGYGAVSLAVQAEVDSIF